MTKKVSELSLTPEQLQVLNSAYPVNEEGDKLVLPRLGMLSKDIIKETGTGKSKKIEVIEAAGTFYTESDKGEADENGKKIWTKDFIDGETIDVQIVYHRYQLKRFDKGLEKFYSTPVYDTADQVLPLYLDKQIVKRGTEEELKALYPKLTQKGKPSSDLNKMTILYVIYNGELHQMNLSVSSGWEFSGYKRKVNPSTVVTTLSSVEETAGSNIYRKMMFNIKRVINSEEFDLVTDNQMAIKAQAEADSKFLLASGEKTSDDTATEEAYEKF